MIYKPWNKPVAVYPGSKYKEQEMIQKSNAIYFFFLKQKVIRSTNPMQYLNHNKIIIPQTK